MVVVDDLTISAAGSLTVEPGTVVKFDQFEGIYVSGELTAVGSGGSPIHFTDYRDDSVGGDSNNNADLNAPAPYWWAGIRVDAGGMATLGYCNIGYAGYYNYAGVRANETGDLSLTDSKVYASSESGLYIYQSTGNILIRRCLFEENKYGVNINGVSHSIALDSCLFEGNTAYGVVNTNSTEVDAVSNWWGDASGPFHTTLNPEAIGDRVSDGVAFDPWSRSAGIAGIGMRTSARQRPHCLN